MFWLKQPICCNFKVWTNDGAIVGASSYKVIFTVLKTGQNMRQDGPEEIILNLVLY